MVGRFLRIAAAMAGLVLEGRVVQAQGEPPSWPPYARFEVAVLAGYRIEGTVTFREPTRYDRVEIDNAPTWGVTGGYHLNPNLEAEIQYSYASVSATAIALFPENPDQPFKVGLHDFQFGLLAYLSGPGRSVRPFLELAVGATVLNSDRSLEERVQFSLGVSVGVKYYFSDHVGLRAEVHYVPVFLYSTGTEIWWCGGYSVCLYTGGHYLQQVDLRGGMTFRF